MVAFELARLYEKTGSNADAIQWYLTASEKFRRAQWKAKAQEALVRLGVEVPLAATEAAALGTEHAPKEMDSEESARPDELFAASESANEFTEATGEPDTDSDAGLTAPGESEGAGTVAAQGAIAGITGEAGKKRRRRGRRGGRGRRKKLPVGAETAAAPVAAEAEPQLERGVDAMQTHRPAPHAASRPAGRISSGSRRPIPSSEAPDESRRGSGRLSESDAPNVSESVGAIGPAAWQARRRAGEPALASRLALLESQLRRMLAAPPATLDDAERAPAGPGVFVLSDSELIDHYYVEACQTLRIGIGNLVRSGRSRGGENIRSRLAEHLGITEARVAKYLKDHCAIRWVQLDDEAPLLAHFAVAVLRPALNE